MYIASCYTSSINWLLFTFFTASDTFSSPVKARSPHQWAQS